MTDQKPASVEVVSAGALDGEESRRVLVVDDELAVANSVGRMLSQHGIVVEVSTEGSEALERLGKTGYDAVISDILMPGMDGIEFLRGVRERDLYVPVILYTGMPSVETATKAIELGVYRYLTKPVPAKELHEVVTKAISTHRLARLRDEAARAVDAGGGAQDRAGLEASFRRTLDALWMAHQPIVLWSDRTVFAYEALMRSDEPALPHPGAMLDAAERLGRVDDLSRAVRARAAADTAALPAGVFQFVNLHPEDLLDRSLYEMESPLSQIADRVVLEITERASLDVVPDLSSRLESLRGLGYRFAVDDLGAGYAGLSAFTLLEPDYVKLDMSLVRDVDQSPRKVAVISSMVELCRGLEVGVIAEGVETEGERDALFGAGCDLLQGYLFAKPTRPYVDPTF